MFRFQWVGVLLQLTAPLRNSSGGGYGKCKAYNINISSRSSCCCCCFCCCISSNSSFCAGFSCHAMEFAVCHGICCLLLKNAELPVFATFISNSVFFGLLFNFNIYKSIKSSRCKLAFMIRVIPCQINQRWKPDHLRIFQKNYRMYWNMSLAYMQNFSLLSCILAEIMSFLPGWCQPVLVSRSNF